MSARYELQPHASRKSIYLKSPLGPVEYALDIPQNTDIISLRVQPPRNPSVVDVPVSIQTADPVDLSTFRPVNHLHITTELSDVNDISVVKDPENKVYIKRSLRKDGAFHHDELISYLREVEYAAIGFIGVGGSVRGRSFPEQVSFMERMPALDLPVQLPIYADEETMIIPFIYGNSLAHTLQTDNTSVIIPALSILNKAHKHGIVLGDRWTANMRVREDTTIVPIDFEVEPGGNNAKELDMTQLLYGMVSQTSLMEETLFRINQFTNEHSSEYDWDRIIHFMEGYNRYLLEKPKSRIPRLGNNLIKLSQAILS